MYNLKSHKSTSIEIFLCWRQPGMGSSGGNAGLASNMPTLIPVLRVWPVGDFSGNYIFFSSTESKQSIETCCLTPRLSAWEIPIIITHWNIWKRVIFSHISTSTPSKYKWYYTKLAPNFCKASDNFFLGDNCDILVVCSWLAVNTTSWNLQSSKTRFNYDKPLKLVTLG